MAPVGVQETRPPSRLPVTTLPALTTCRPSTSFSGLPGYIVAIVVLTPGYQLFQAANNAAVMAGIPAEERGVTSGLLNLSRNLGLITGASLMGAIFTLAIGTKDVTGASAPAVATGMHVTFAVAAILLLIALALVRGFKRQA